MPTLVWAQAASDTYTELRSAAQESLKNRGGKGKSSKQEGLFMQVHKCVEHLSLNPRNPGLNTHKFDGIDHPYKDGAPVFEAYAQNNTPSAYRVFWCYGPDQDTVTIIAITPHP